LCKEIAEASLPSTTRTSIHDCNATAHPIMFRNIKYFSKPPIWHKYWKQRKSHPLEKPELEAFNKDWLANRASKFFDQETIELVLTARRPTETPELIQASFDKFEHPQHFIIRDEHFDNGIKWTTEHGRPNRKLHPVAFPDLRYYPWNLPPNAEAPWNIEGYRFKPDYRNVDAETEMDPKLQEKVEGTFAFTLRDSISVDKYLKIKHSLGMIDNPAPTFHNLYNEIFTRNRRLIHEIKHLNPRFWNEDGTPKPYFWYTVHIKTTVVEEGDDDKIRVVFGAPKLLLQAENMFLWPLQSTYLNTGTGFMMWGREIIRGGWKKVELELSHIDHEHGILCIDWSGWDKRFSFELQSEIHKIWRSYYDFNFYEPTSTYPDAQPDPSQIERLWHWTWECTKYTPHQLPDGRLAQWRYSGYGSGYQGTQLTDSFGNAIVTTTSASAMGIKIFEPSFYAKFQGDDAIVRFLLWLLKIYGPTFLPKFADCAKYYFGHDLSIKKSQALQTIEKASMLSYYNKHGLPYRTKEDLLRHLFFPRRARSWSETAGATLGLAYANAGIHPRFHALCEYIWNKIVHEKQIEPKLARHDLAKITQGMPAALAPQAIETKEFPTFLELSALVQTHTPRSHGEKQRLWPTEPGPRGKFYFLKPV